MSRDFILEKLGRNLKSSTPGKRESNARERIQTAASGILPKQPKTPTALVARFIEKAKTTNPSNTTSTISRAGLLLAGSADGLPVDSEEACAVSVMGIPRFEGRVEEMPEGAYDANLRRSGSDRQ